MVEIKITISELVDILTANNVLNNFLSEIRFEGDYISFNFNTGQFFPRYIPISLLFKNYSSGQIIYEISTTWVSDKLLKLLPVKTDEFIRINFPKLIVNIQKVASVYLKGIHLRNIEYSNGLYHISFLVEKIRQRKRPKVKKNRISDNSLKWIEFLYKNIRRGHVQSGTRRNQNNS